MILLTNSALEYMNKFPCNKVKNIDFFEWAAITSPPKKNLCVGKHQLKLLLRFVFNYFTLQQITVARLIMYIGFEQKKTLICFLLSLRNISWKSPTT